MLGLIRGSVPWRLRGFWVLLLLEGACCLAGPSSSSGLNQNQNQNPNVNIYMSVEEVKKILGKKNRKNFLHVRKLLICVCCDAVTLT